MGFRLSFVAALLTTLESIAVSFRPQWGQNGNVANTSARMLRLLSLLQTHRYWPGAELAARLEVSPRTLRRDVDRLRGLGYPVHAQRGVDGGYQLAAGAALPPLLVDDDEAVALAVGLQAAAESSVAGIAESSVRALAKVVQVMPGRLRRRVEALRAMTVPASLGYGARTSVDPGVLTGVAVACRDAERLRFRYTTADGRRSARHVEPYRLVSLGRRWYLVGYDLDRQDWRSYRIDRLAEPQGTGARFRPRDLPGADAAAFVRAGIDSVFAVYEVEVLVDAPAPVVRDRIGRWSTVEELDAGRCRVRMTADSLDWPTMALGAVGADFRVLSPAELAGRLGDWGRRFTRAARLGADRAGTGTGDG
jgi:predicted DNA-binding transcriptional regulator YafY